MFFNRITPKFIAAISSLLLANSFVLGYLFLQHERKSSETRVREYAAMVARNLAANAEYGVLTRNRDMLYALVQDTMLQNRMVLAVRICDRTGAVLQEAGRDFPPSYSTDARIMTNGSAPEHENITGMSSEEMLLTPPADVRKEMIGRVYLSVSLDVINQELAAVTKTVALITLGVLGFSLVVMNLLIRRMTLPIERLASATEKIAAGNFSHRVDVMSGDEIGQLARSFNKMTEELSRTIVSKSYVDDIFCTMLDLLIVTGGDNRIKTVNAAAVQVLGYSAEELAGKPLEMLLPRAAGAAWRKQLADKGAFANVEEEYCTRSGVAVPVLLSGAVMRSGAGDIVYAALDIRKRKEAERQKEALAEQLRHSEKIAAVGQLASGVAHEINNPLGVILGFAQYALQTVQEGPLYLPLVSIEREAKRCKSLVQDLLVFSRRDRMKKEKCALNDVVKAALALVEAQTKTNAINLLKEFDETVPPVVVNNVQIQQVVVNLCNNGIDAMPSGGTLAVRTRRMADGGRPCAAIIVADTGCGIPKEEQSKIFEPFFTTKEVGKGTGLGLSLIYEIVQKHEGKIVFQSEPGKGTTFTVLLPVA